MQGKAIEYVQNDGPLGLKAPSNFLMQGLNPDNMASSQKANMHSLHLI